MKFITKNSSHSTLHIAYTEKYVEETVNTKLLGLQTDNHINWKHHIEQTIRKLSGACYAVRSMVHIRNTITLKSIYFVYFHSVIKYGIIWGGGLTLPAVGRFSLYKRKSPALWLLLIPEPQVEVCLNNYRFYLSHISIYTFINKFHYQ